MIKGMTADFFPEKDIFHDTGLDAYGSSSHHRSPVQTTSAAM
jgi:hypothetical protein